MRMFKPHMTAMCEVAELLARRLDMPEAFVGTLAYLTDRWDGKGPLGRAERDQIPLPLRIAQVAHDAGLQRMLGGAEHAARIVRERAGAAFDPELARLLADGADELLALEDGSVWDEVLACEPSPPMQLEGPAIDRALAAMGDFADLSSPSFSGRSSGVADLVEAAALNCGLDAATVASVRRAGLVHDIGRVSVHPRTWHRTGPLTPDETEQVRLHAYHTERVLLRAPALAPLAPLAGAHHERLDGSGYHRGSRAADAVRARLGCSRSPTPTTRCASRARTARRSARTGAERSSPPSAVRGRLDADAAAAVLAAAGQPAPPRRAAGGAHRARGRGRPAARARPADQAGRPRARRLGEDGRPPRTERLREDRRLDARGGDAVRDGARPAGLGRTPDGERSRPLPRVGLATGAHRAPRVPSRQEADDDQRDDRGPRARREA